jgi:hypothetical protein
VNKNKPPRQDKSGEVWKMNAKGTHVGIIISFAVFITFIVFLFFIFEPSLSFNNEKEIAIDSIKTLLLRNFSAELTTATVNINPDVILSGTCLRLNSLHVLSDAGFDGSHIFVKDSAGSNLEFDWLPEQKNLQIENSGANRFFKIYQSLGIKSSETSFSSCTDISNSDYSLGIAKTEEKIFEQNILDAIELYKTNYTKFKMDLGISSDEFGFDFIYDNGTILSAEENSQITGIYTETSSISYIDKNLDGNIGSIVIKIS